MAKSLGVAARLDCARAAVAVLRTLQTPERDMSYGHFAQAIGLMSEGEGWQPWHRQQVKDILNLVAATERKAGQKAERLPIKRIVTAKDGQPGAGYYKTSKIVIE